LDIKEYFCDFEEAGEFKKFHHVAMYYRVELKVEQLKKTADGRDSLGARMVWLDEINDENTAPMVYELINDMI